MNRYVYEPIFKHSFPLLDENHFDKVQYNGDNLTSYVNVEP